MKDLIPVYFIRLLALLPLSICRLVGEILGGTLWFLQSKEAIVTQKNLHYCFPELDDKERAVLAKRSLKESSKTFCETGPVWIWPESKILNMVKQVHGRDLLDDAIARGKGVMMIAPHLGNWEVLGLYLQTIRPITNMYLPSENKALDALIRASRTRSGSKLTPTNRRGVMTLLKTLKKGEIVGVLPDQVPEDGGGLFAPFYQQAAFTMKLVPNLAHKTGCSVLCGYAKRVPHGFDIHFIEAEPELSGDCLDKGVVALNKSVENCVAQAIEQYQWEYKRFKKQPDGRSKFYDSLLP